YPCQYVSFTLGMYHACCLGNPLGVNVFMGQFMPQGAAVPVLVATTFALLALVLLIMLLRTRRHYDHLLQEKHAVELELARLDTERHERQRAFELMKQELEDSRERLTHEFQLLASRVLH